MRKTLFSILLSAAAIQSTFAGEPITLRDMGSFHVGGRVVEISGKPVKELVFGAGGVPAKVDPTAFIRSSRCMCSISFRRTARANIRC